MKKFLLLLFAFILFASAIYSQWTNQNIVPDGNELWSTFFIDDTGWIVGEDGFIKKTTNAGLDWIQQNSGATLTLRSVQFIDKNTGWICGDQGLLLKTTNGGQNWLELTSGTSEKLVDLYFYDLYIGWLVGDGETILKTTNGGTTWAIQSSGTSFNLNSVDFVDAFVGYAVGETIILKTTDGGLNWIDKSIDDPHIRFNTVEFIDANTGWIGGIIINQGVIYKTTDGGETWGTQKLMKVNGDESYGITSIFFKDSDNGYAVSGGSSKNIRTTTNGGSTWVVKITEGIYSGSLNSVYINSTGKGWAVGSGGGIFITENDGNSWTHILSGKGFGGDDIYSVFFINENIGWASGQRHVDANAHIILKTTNGGKIWKTQYFNVVGASSHQLNCVYFTDANNGWAVGTYGKILRTRNGGTEWTQQTSGTTTKLYGVSFTNVNNGTAVGASGIILRTTNGGTDWTQQTSGTTNSLFGISFTDVNNGIAVGAGGIILRTTNGGIIWTSQTSGTTNNLNCIKFFNSSLGVCAGDVGKVLLSYDGGENWVEKSSGTTNDLKTVTFTNSISIWVAGSNGEILSTTDLGNNWISYDQVTANNLTSLFFINENTGWIGGIDGTIFKYFDCPASQITVIKPNGGEMWKAGTTRNITWLSCGVENVNLYYSTNNGASWISIASNEPAAAGSYTWTVPSLKSLFCKIKIEDTSNSSIADESDGTFIIWKLCTVVHMPILGQQSINFGETNTDIGLFVNTIDQITTTYFEYESPALGTLPSGIVVISEYYWQINSPGISFTEGKISVPISTLRGVEDASKLVWLKRTNSGDPWENIGGIVLGDNLECTTLFNSLSEFSIGSNDPVNPLPVELHSFEASVKSSDVYLKWQTKTEVKNYGFEVERCLDDVWEKLGFVEGHGNSNSPKSYYFTDINPLGGSRFRYRLKQMDTDGQFEYSNDIEVEIIPTKFVLYQNYPNPFNPNTTIRYQLPVENKVVIKIYDMLGAEIMTLLSEKEEAGIYEVELNAESLSSGTYIYRIVAGEFVETKKMVLMK